MLVSENVTATLRANMKHHEPIVVIPIDTMSVAGRPDPVNDKRMGGGDR